jgi:hypothetical protein
VDNESLQMCGKRNCILILGLALICVVCLLRNKQSIWPVARHSLLNLHRPCHPELPHCGWKYVSYSHICHLLYVYFIIHDFIQCICYLISVCMDTVSHHFTPFCQGSYLPRNSWNSHIYFFQFLFIAFYVIVKVGGNESGAVETLLSKNEPLSTLL